MDYTSFRKDVIDGNDTVINRTNQFISSIESKANLNAFITNTFDLAKEKAEESDRRFKQSEPRKLEGMIIAIKDNISTKGIKTTCGSKILNNFIPVFNATVIERLESEGAIIIGKTNMDEFAMGSSNETSYFGPVHHPLNQDYVPGGSSGGSSVAVAADMAFTALGSDTGGSIRQPAAFCGNIGFKPTYGSVSRYGLVAFASSLDQIGSFANSIEDTAILFDIISGIDPKDSTTVDIPKNVDYTKLSNIEPKKTRIGVLPDKEINNCDDDVLNVYYSTLDKLRNESFEIEEIEFENFDTYIPTYYIIATAEASSNLARFDGMRYGYRAEFEKGEDLIVKTRSEGFGEEVKRRIMLGTYVLSSGYYDAYYGKALKARRLIYNNYKKIFANNNFIFLPTTPTPPFKIGEKADDPISMYLSDLFTTSANLGSIPAISLPLGTSSNGFPIGMQLQANHFDEYNLFSFSKFLLSL